MVQCVYRMVLLPRFLHASVVWWIRSQLKTVKLKLEQLQAMVFRGVTGAMRTTPTSALGHSVIRGNEEADTLARRGSEMTLIGPEPAVGIMPGAVKGAIQRWSRICHEREWAETTVGRQAMALLGLKLNRGFAESLLKLNKIRVRAVVRLLTGRGLLNYHQHKIGRNVSPRCRLCDAEEESSTHILCHCPAYAASRHQCWGHAFVDPDRIRDLSVEELLDFWNKTGL
ncbi:uncharacterized protein LOC127285360 [Leptopilina boulardi]|uniref:uncharacterized protein LOC127285360 n=1 Tax=Leptopilina boulardi TaxID=63433 RepID=UPI0021F650D4|nr:uncharacterized protein LOC127285360 [Leptopilina boulardi]